MASQKPAARRPFSAVVGDGDYRRSLEALRDLLAGQLELAEPGQVAALARQLASVLAVLDSLAVPEVSGLDEIARRRADRRAAAKVSDGS